MAAGADILIPSVVHAEALLDGSQLDKAQPLIQVPGMDIGGHHCVELQHAKAMSFALSQAILHQLLTDMQAAAGGAHRIAGVADMPAPPHIVGMQDVQAVYGAGIGIFHHTAVGLSGKKDGAGGFVQTILLREGDTLLHHRVPDSDHRGQIGLCVSAHLDIHAILPPISFGSRLL